MPEKKGKMDKIMEKYMQWYYRGSMHGCNYTCAYCPFSKKRDSASSLEKDKESLYRFVRYMNDNLCKDMPHNAVQIVPYGEAMQYDYYYKALAVLSKNDYIDAVGIQSNMSFSVENMLLSYKESGGDLSKLRIWGTFHPDMTDIERFTKKCDSLSEAGIKYCVGAVAVPEKIEILRELRKRLPKAVYMWLNRMDIRNDTDKKYNGTKKCIYTREQIHEFEQIDRYFFMEMRHHRADRLKCNDSLFVETDGTVHGCNICKQTMGNLYENDIKTICSMEKRCSRKECDCYLSYCNQKEDEMMAFGSYPAFRIADEISHKRMGEK